MSEQIVAILQMQDVFTWGGAERSQRVTFEKECEARIHILSDRRKERRKRGNRKSKEFLCCINKTG